MSHDFHTIVYPCYLKVKEDYPPEKFVWVYEKALVGVYPRCMPDIAILDRQSKVWCVVEIGYTDAKKILRYCKMGIADIRWYSKDLELCHQWGSSQPKEILTCRK